MTVSWSSCASLCSNVSARPSAKYSSAGSPEKFSNGSTAIESPMPGSSATADVSAETVFPAAGARSAQRDSQTK